MSYNFYDLLKTDDGLENMPNIEISKRPTDKYIVFNSTKMRMDRIAGDLYGDETMYRIVLWANPEIEYEFDNVDDIIIRVPFPFQDVLKEVSEKISLAKSR
jgi:hypothetical protein